MPKEYARKLRINVQLQQVLAGCVRQLRDPRVAGVTITDVDASPDMRSARVKVSLLGDDAALAAAVAGLNHAAGRLRHQVGSALALRYLPQLRFEADTALRAGDRLGALIQQAVRQDEGHAQQRGDAPDIPPADDA